MQYTDSDTIAAIATPSGKGALAIVRISGPKAFSISDSIWNGSRLSFSASHTAHLGNILDEDGNVLDQALATVFAGPNSFTGEDTVEFSLHASPWIIREVINLLLRKGARGAEPGEFTQRAYLNGRMDLASAEGVAELIAASSRATHRLAIQQTRGAFSREFNSLRDILIQLASLLELELDFSEEDVEFADRSAILDTANDLLFKINRLTKSYSAGRAFKEGVPVVIAGIPNVGKSTLLNALLEEDKAIVSDIPGTTRDIIEDTCEIEGVLFRFIDTAGLRKSTDKIENIGIDRARMRLSQASIILWLIDPTSPVDFQIREMSSSLAALAPGQQVITVITKTDIGVVSTTDIQEIEDKIHYASKSLFPQTKSDSADISVLKISTAEDIGIDILKQTLKKTATEDFNPENELILTNSRHYSDLMKAGQALERAIAQIKAGASADFIAMDIREATHALSSLTGEITTPDLLSSIFSRFCIGK